MKFILGLWIEMVVAGMGLGTTGVPVAGNYRERGLGAMHSDGVRAATAEESLKGAEERLTLSPAPDKYSNSCPGPAQAAPDVCSTPGLEESA